MFSTFDILLAIIAGLLSLFIPIGIGLLLIYNKTYKINNAQLLLFSYLFGSFLLVYLFVLMERIGNLKLSWQLLTSICILSFMGLSRARSLFKTNFQNKKEIFTYLICFLSVLIIHYISTLVIYSEFPVLDLFQRVHFHAGAFSFSNYNILNPFYANSYIPFQQVMLGLTNFLGADPLLMEWTLPLALAPLKIIAVYVFVEKFVENKKLQLVTICLIISILGISNPTNGKVSEIATFLLLSLLISKKNGNISNEIKKLSFLFIVFLVCIFILKQSIYLLAFLISFLFLFFHLTNTKLNQQFFIIFSIFLVLLFHRSGLMYVPFAFMIYILYFLTNIYKFFFIRIIRFLILFLIICLLVVSIIILLSDGNKQDIFGLWKLFDLILNPLVGKSLSNLSLDKDLAIGSGSYITLFEVARSLSFFLVVVSIPLYKYFNFVCIKGKFKKYQNSLNKANVLFFISLLMIGLILTGFPFIHRSSFLIVALLSISLVLYLDVFIKSSSTKHSGYILIFFLIYAVCLILIVNVISTKIIDVYLSKVYNILIFIFILISFITFLTWKNKKIRFGIFSVLILVTLFEIVLQKAYFKKYAFGGMVPVNKEEAFSHFNYRQLETVGGLSEKIDNYKVIIISDPKTMALISARTGNTPITSFSNLNTLPDSSERLLIDLLNTIKRGALDNQICNNSFNLLDNHASSTYNYLNTNLELKSGALALNVLGYNNALVPKGIEKKELEKKELEKKELEKKELEKYSFIIVINYDTLKWIENPKDFLYFPQNGNDEDIINLTNNQANEYIMHDTYIKELKCIK